MPDQRIARRLRAAMEDEFGVTFEVEDMMKFRSLREIEACLEAG